MQDARFAHAYEMGKRTGSWDPWDIHWRAYIACWAANKVKDLPGDFVECGVNRGGLAMTVMTYIDFRSLPKCFYLLDTFCGLVEKYISEEERQRGIKPGGYEECYESVCATFRDYPNVSIVRGSVPDTLPQVASDKICYLSIDMNCREPEIAAAEYFWEKLVGGAVVLLDDYGFTGHLAQKQAFDAFAAQRGVQVLSLPTGQGLIIKP